MSKSVYDGVVMREIFIDAKGENRGHYAAGIISNGTLYISGQLSIDLDTRQVCSGGIREHAAMALHNMERVLLAAGLTKDNVVHCRVYLTDQSYWDEFNEVYKDFFGTHRPARIITAVSQLHFGCLVEIEAIAEVPSDEN